MTDTILLMGHGSRDEDGALEFLEVVDAVRARLRDVGWPVATVDAAPGVRVEAGFLEFAGSVLPTIDAAIDACAARGDRRILAVPMLLFEAIHGREDMPAVVAAARARHPGLDLRASGPLGPHRAFLELVEERVAAVGAPEGQDAALLLVGRGASCAGANADLYRIGRLLWERNRYGMVECCFSGTAQPDIAAGVDRCVRLGARRVVLAPYFINTGTLVKRIHAEADAARGRHPDKSVAVAGHFGADPRLVDVVLARAGALLEPRRDPAMGDRGWRYPRGHHHHHGHDSDHHHDDGHLEHVPRANGTHDQDIRPVPADSAPVSFRAERGISTVPGTTSDQVLAAAAEIPRSPGAPSE